MEKVFLTRLSQRQLKKNAGKEYVGIAVDVASQKGGLE